MVLLYCYEGTNITGKKAVNPHRTQLNDALIASQHHVGLPQGLVDGLRL
jgi:hypothetical protein